jgi:HAD superfamily phosphoserine phosphatase-like hydrolase
MNLVIFDFCETICKIQSANKFVDFCLKKLCIKGIYFKILSFFSSNMFVLRIMSTLFPTFNFSKRVKLFALRGIEQSDLLIIAKDFFEYLINDLNDEIVSILERHVNEGDHVIIVSGGYYEYLNYFKSYFKIKAIISTKIAFKNSMCLGYFDGVDCMFDEKINLIQKYIYSSNLKFERSICYTDNISDLSSLQWVDDPIVVSDKSSQQWPQEYSFKEIIINNQNF